MTSDSKTDCAVVFRSFDLARRDNQFVKIGTRARRHANRGDIQTQNPLKFLPCSCGTSRAPRPSFLSRDSPNPSPPPHIALNSLLLLPILDRTPSLSTLTHAIGTDREPKALSSSAADRFVRHSTDKARLLPLLRLWFVSRKQRRRTNLPNRAPSILHVQVSHKECEKLLPIPSVKPSDTSLQLEQRSFFRLLLVSRMLSQRHLQ